MLIYQVLSLLHMPRKDDLHRANYEPPSAADASVCAATAPSYAD